MNTTFALDVIVGDTTVVDYMRLRLWPCPPPNPWTGLPHLNVGTNASRMALMPQIELPAFGPVGDEPALSLMPDPDDPTQTTSTRIQLGGGQAFSFTTVLDVNAPEGAHIIVSAPTSDGTNAPLFALVKGKCPPKCNWDIKPLKKFWDDGGAACRVSAVSENGDLLDSFAATEADTTTDSLFSLAPEPGVDQFPVSLLFDSATGEITVMFPGAVARRKCGNPPLPCPRGWDGTIKGRVTEEARRKGWDGTVKCPCYDEGASRIVFRPTGTNPPPPRPFLEVGSVGLSELLLTAEQLILLGETNRPVRIKKLGPGSNEDFRAGLFLAAPDGDGVSLTAFDDAAGVSLDLGNAATIDVGIHHFENGDLPMPEQLFRLGGPKWPIALTNRPPPPPIDVRLIQGPDGVECYVDFYWLELTGVTVQLYNNGVLIGRGRGDGNILATLPVILGAWPERLSLSDLRAGLRLTSSEPFMVGTCCSGDELRIIPELSSGAPVPESFSELQCLASEGLESLLYDLRTTSACTPAPLNVTRTADGIVVTWERDGFRLLGAESVNGPWLDLGTSSPVTLGAGHPARFFRLVCD